MIDINEYKKRVKIWIYENPEASEAELIDYCESIIPSHQFSSYKWLVDETFSWYRSIIQSRKSYYLEDDDKD